MLHIKNILKTLLFLVCGVMTAQQDNNYTLYKYSMNAVNPAYAGADGMTSFTSNLRSQWVGVKDAPESQTFMFSTTAGDRVGLGVTLVTDAVFIEKRTGIYVDFSYRLQLSQGTNLFLGLKAGGRTYRVDTQGLFSVGGVDPAVGNINSKFKPNVGMGAYLQNEKYFVSLSMPKLLASSGIDNENGIVTYATDKAHIYLSGGYNFFLNKGVEFRPSVMVRHVSGAPLSTDFTAAVKFMKRFELGVSYRTDGIVSGLGMINLADWMDFGYAYESSRYQEITNISGGTHEILIRFNFGRR